MERRTAAGLALAATALTVAAVLAGYGLWTQGVPGGTTDGAVGEPTDRALVGLHDADGSRLATVDARVAATPQERYTGLSETESLANGSGMLFVHSEVGTQAYVMREMAFPLDMVFVAPCDGDCPDGVDGRVTTIHEAPLPPPDAENLERYEGRAKWVLEVPRGYTDGVGLDEGEYVSIEYVNATETASG